MDDFALARFRHEWSTGSRSLARELAVEYIANAHQQLHAILGAYSREGLVALCGAYRDRDDSANATIVEMWLLAKHEPQTITGSLNVRLPSPKTLILGGARNGRLLN